MWPGGERVAVALVAGLSTLAVSSVAAAQAPEAVRDGQAAPGVYVGSNPVDPATLAATVSRARAAGVELVVVVAEDPRPDVEAFAIRVRQLDVGDPVLVIGPDGQLGTSSEAVPGSDLMQARSAAIAASGTPAAVTEAFVGVLLQDEDAAIPGHVTDVARFGVAALVVLIVTVAADRRLRRRRRSAQRRPVAAHRP